MQFTGVCLITRDLPRLRGFYSRVLEIEPGGDEIAPTFRVEGAELSLFAADGMEAMAPGSIVGAGSGNAVLEFRVDDVDREFGRLVALGVPVVKPPETYPWGRRSAWFRDPDGNILNFYALARPPVVTRSQLASDLRALGLDAGQTVMVHSSIRALGRIVGGPDTVIHSLLDVLTESGTIIVYVSWEEWERALTPHVDTFPAAERQAYLEECPPFDPTTSRAERRWGVLTEYLRTWPGALRSNHPTASVAAVGAGAEYLTADHPLAYGYGVGSPFERLCQRRGKVLLLGSPFSAVSLLHYAEHIAPIPNKVVVINKTPLLVDGVRTWVVFEEFDTGGGIVPGEANEEYFVRLMRDYVAAGRGRKGRVGTAETYLFDATDLVAFAVEWMVQRWGQHAD